MRFVLLSSLLLSACGPEPAAEPVAPVGRVTQDGVSSPVVEEVRGLVERAQRERLPALLDQAQALLDEGGAALEEPELWRARGELELARWRLASQLGGHHDPVAAVGHFERALALRPDDRDSLRGLARALEVSGQRERAIAAAEQVLAIDPGEIGMLILQARSLDGLGEHDRARAVFERALDQAETQGDGARVHVIRAMLGESLAASGQTEQAEALLLDSAQRLASEQRGPDQGPLPSCPYEALGGLYKATGREVAAAEMMVESARLQADSPAAQLLAAEALLSQDDPQGALLYLDRARALHESPQEERLRDQAQRELVAVPSFEPGLEGAVELFLLGRFLSARRALEEAPDDHRAAVLRGFLLTATERYELAAERFGSVLAEHPDDPGALVGLAHLAIVDQDYPETDRCLMRAEEVGALSGQRSDGYPWLVTRMALLGLAWRHGNQAQHERALLAFDSLLARDPDDRLALLGRGNALNALGRLAEAQASLERVLALDPGNRYALSELALLQFNRGNDAQAEQLFQRALEQDAQGYTCPYEGLGMVYLRQGKLDRAQDHFERAIDIDPDIEFRKYNGLARIYIEDGRLDEAEALLRRSVRNYPYDPEAPAMLEEIEALRSADPR
jgi:tetratricopeptide (TPR) repeat protein